MNEDDIIEILDSLVSLPKRDTLNVIIRAKKPLAASEIATSLRISVSETLDYLQALERNGLIASIKNSNVAKKTTWYFTQPLMLEVKISEEGVVFRQAKYKASIWRRLYTLFRLR